MSKIPVTALYENCEMMLRDRWGYIYGTAGVMCTQKVIDAAIEKFPKYAETTKKYGPQWIGHMVTDCSGVMVYIWKQYGKKIPHGSSSMVSQKYIVDCSDTPKPGYAALVDPTPDTYDNNHIGIVGKDGITIYEAKGTQSGFTTSTINDKRWTKYGRFVDVDYEVEDGGEVVDPMYTAIVSTQNGNLNMRSGPGKSYGVIMSIPKGATVEVIAEYGNGWDCVRYKGKVGYVSADYLIPENNPTDPPAENENETTEQWMVVIPCENETEARRYAGDIKNAIIVRSEKPPND